MGMMIKLRESTSVVLWIVVFAFGGLWVLQDSGAFDNLGMGARQHIAIVDGVPISFQEYNEALEQRLRAYRQETGEEPSPQVRDRFADEVYQEMVDDVIREREMDRMGITVSNAELRDMIIGPNPDPLMVQLFPDAEGGVDRATAIELLNNPEQFAMIYGIDPSVLENYLRAKRRAEKLDALLTSSVRVTSAEIESEYVRRNSRASAEYVALRYAAIPDDEVEVTDRDLQQYYRANRDDFRRPRTVTLDYVAVSQTPSAADTQAVLNRLDGLRDELARTANDSLYVTQRFSDIPYSSEFRTPGSLEPQLAAAVYRNLERDRIVGPLAAGGRGMIAKITDFRPSDQPAIRARHILFGQQGQDDAARQQSHQQAQQVMQQIRDGQISFADAARRYSQDPGSAQRGGDLGYFTRGRMVQPFEEAAFGASVGEVVGPVESQFGYHVIEVTGRAEQDVQLAIIAHDITLGSATLRQLRDRVEDIKYYSEDSGNLQAEAERLGLEVQTVTVQADQEFIPGIGANRAVIDFVNRTRANRGSDVIDTGEHFVYLRATDVQREGHRSLDEVRDEIEPRVRLEKKREIQVARLREAFQQHGFEGLADAVESPQRTAQDVRLTNATVPALGNEPKFVGTALGLSEGATSNVIAGANAAYVLRVTSRTIADPAAMTDSERENIRTAVATRKIRQLSNEWMTDLRDRAIIEDFRAQLL